jgi:EthD domain
MAEDVDLTLVLPLRAKDSMSLEDFYEYWLNAHVTLPPRFPGISSIWLHVISFGRQRWPHVPGASNRPEPEDEFHGVPEATFPTMADLELFQAYSQLQMEDGINFLAEMIAYSSLGPNSATVVDKLEDDTPDGHDGLLRHLVFLRRRSDVPVAELRRFVTDTLAPAYASSPEVLKLRRHLFEEVEVTLDHPGVVMSKPLERQYQAALEVVVAEEDALRRFAASPAWTGTVDDLAAHCKAVHAARVDRCITTKYQGAITLAGVRGVAVADIIRRLGAQSQRDPAVSSLFLPELTSAPG